MGFLCIKRELNPSIYIVQHISVINVVSVHGWMYPQYFTNIISTYTGDVMVSVLASSSIDRGFEPWSGQTKDYKIGKCCFSAKYAALWKKSKDWLARNQNNVPEWSDMSTSGLLFQWASTIKIQLSVLV